MNKVELFDTMQMERERWESLLAQVDKTRMDQPGVEGAWTVKDIIAHVTAYERWIVARVQSALQDKKPLQLETDPLDVDQANAIIFEENRNRSVAEVLAESKEVFQQLLATVEALSDEDLADGLAPYLDSAWTEGLPLWKCIMADSSEHYHQHIPSIQAWLESQHV